MTQKIIVNDPTFAKKLFSEVGAWSLVWLFLRVWLGWGWISAGWGKITGDGAHPWGPETILGFWQKAVAIPQPPARPAIAYDWYRSFLEFLISINAESWMASVVAWGEFLVGIALIAGAFVGIAAAIGAFMNMNFMLAGAASTNPVMMLAAILIVLAWKTAGWWGFDRWLLPRLGTPWSRVQVEKVNNDKNQQQYMKTIKSIVISLLFIPVLAFAHELVALPNAGLTPESAFYFVDKIGEALREFFTFNPESKAHLQIDFAAERIAEIKIILETKGVNAKGLGVAESRLQANIARVAGIVESEKSKGKDVSELAKSISEDFDANKEALKQAFKAEERSLEAKEDELKAKIREARRLGDTAQIEALAKELGEIKAQKELLELKEEEQEEALEQEEEKIEREMEEKEDAEKAIKEAEEEKQEVLDEAAEEGMRVPAEAFEKFDKLLAQAKELFSKENYVGAKQLAKQAEDALEKVEDAIEDLDEAKEEEEELKEEQEDRVKEGVKNEE